MPNQTNEAPRLRAVRKSAVPATAGISTSDMRVPEASANAIPEAARSAARSVKAVAPRPRGTPSPAEKARNPHITRNEESAYVFTMDVKYTL